MLSPPVVLGFASNVLFDVDRKATYGACQRLGLNNKPYVDHFASLDSLDVYPESKGEMEADSSAVNTRQARPDDQGGLPQDQKTGAEQGGAAPSGGSADPAARGPSGAPGDGRSAAYKALVESNICEGTDFRRTSDPVVDVVFLHIPSEGFLRSISILSGEYCCVGINHKMPVYEREARDQKTGEKVQLMMYYWGIEPVAYQGWWIGCEVGSTETWLYAPVIKACDPVP